VSHAGEDGVPGNGAIRFHLYGDRLVNTAVRGVCPEYGEMRHEIPREGRWITPIDLTDRARVAFLGGKVKDQLFSGRNAVWRGHCDQRRPLSRDRPDGPQTATFKLLH